MSLFPLAEDLSNALTKVSEGNTGWISVKDRMPEYGESVLVCYSRWRVYWCDTRHISVGHVESKSRFGYKWLIYDAKGDSHQRAPSHWMKLPKLPNQ